MISLHLILSNLSINETAIILYELITDKINNNNAPTQILLNKYIFQDLNNIIKDYSYSPIMVTAYEN